MSIDLFTELTHPVALRSLLPKMGEVLAEMLGLAVAPELTLHVVESGDRQAAASDELRDESSPQFLIALHGEPEAVDLLVPGKHVSVSIARQRSNLEYALGAAVAIALARELGGPIEDDWRFFGEAVQVPPDDMLRRLKVAGMGRGYREAAELLTGKLGRKQLADENPEVG